MYDHLLNPLLRKAETLFMEVERQRLAGQGPYCILRDSQRRQGAGAAVWIIVFPCVPDIWTAIAFSHPQAQRHLLLVIMLKFQADDTLENLYVFCE